MYYVVREEVCAFVYVRGKGSINVCACVRLGVPIHSGDYKTPLTCAIFQEKRQGQGPVASAARRFPSYYPK